MNAISAALRNHSSELTSLPEKLLSISDEPASENGTKLRVDNLHYDLTEDDLRVKTLVHYYSLSNWLNVSKQELFSRIGRVINVSLLYDRQDRSKGVAFVYYAHESDARVAIREFDGANAHGQPIRLTEMPSKQQQQQPSRNPFDHVERPSRSLFERVDSSNNSSVNANSRISRRRSTSPNDDDGDSYRARRSIAARPPPEHIDRYVPNRRNTRSPMPRIGGGGRDAGRRPGARRDNSVRKDIDGGRGAGSDRGRGGGSGNVGGSGIRPKKTSDELDAEMEDYWGDRGTAVASNGPVNNHNQEHMNAVTVGAAEEDVDMIE